MTGGPQGWCAGGLSLVKWGHHQGDRWVTAALLQAALSLIKAMLHLSLRNAGATLAPWQQLLRVQQVALNSCYLRSPLPAPLHCHSPQQHAAIINGQLWALRTATALASLLHLWGVQVTCEHVRHNKSGIAHRGSSKVEAPTGTPTPGLSHFSAGGREFCLEEQW